MRKLKMLIASTLVLTLCSATVVSAAPPTDCMGTEYCNCMNCECENCIDDPVEAQPVEESVPVSAAIIGIVITDGNIAGIMDSISGVYVEDVMPNSPAAESGIYRGDLITAFNGEEVTCVNDLLTKIAQYNPDEDVVITVTLVNSFGYYKQIDYEVKLVDRIQFIKKMGRGKWAYHK